MRCRVLMLLRVYFHQSALALQAGVVRLTEGIGVAGTGHPWPADVGLVPAGVTYCGLVVLEDLQCFLSILLSILFLGCSLALLCILAFLGLFQFGWC